MLIYWCTAVCGAQRIRHDLATKQQQSRALVSYVQSVIDIASSCVFMHTKSSVHSQVNSVTKPVFTLEVPSFTSGSFLERAALAEEALRVLLLPPWPSVCSSLRRGDTSPGPCGLGWPRLVLPLILSCLESGLACRLQGDKPVSEVTSVPSLSGCCLDSQPLPAVCLDFHVHTWEAPCKLSPGEFQQQFQPSPFLPHQPCTMPAGMWRPPRATRRPWGCCAGARPAPATLPTGSSTCSTRTMARRPSPSPPSFQVGTETPPTPQVWCIELNGFFKAQEP